MKNCFIVNCGFVFFLVLLLFLGCVKPSSVCNKPYFEYKKGECCLDENNNKVCDKDETINPEGSERFKAPVSQVIDGDSIIVEGLGEVRILGINAPEIGQPYYKDAKEQLAKLVSGKTIELESDEESKDKYGRNLRYVFLDGKNIAVKMVEEGLATVYILPPNTKYETQLRQAWERCLSDKSNLCETPRTGCDNRCIGVAYFNWNAEGNDCENLNDEYVSFKNTCEIDCGLTGWSVKDESSRDPYVFPEYTLKSLSEVTLYTGDGKNTHTNLFWNNTGMECNSIWNNAGDTLYLRNKEGELILSHTYKGFNR
ncbi:MAG: hypothetical protein GF334_00100 [Candidatus Altiarchaeales archaeon]|nr:hypothetical protein [Candidatus Altiarchaeales archaeon]